MRQRIRWINTCFALALTVTVAAAETRAGRPTFRADPEYLIDTWETEDGLPENSATAMVQAADGYLWFGTFKGLVRFDGLAFSVFDPSEAPGRLDSGVVNLHLDRAGRLWVSTLRGLVMREEGRWRAVDGWEGDFVRSFAERSNGDLLLTTFDGRVLELTGGRLRALPAPPGEPGRGYFGSADDAGQWWVAQHGFVGRWDGARWVQTVTHGGDAGVPVSSTPARDGGLWLLSGQELRKLRGGREVVRLTLPGFRGGVWSLTEDGAGNVWICTFDRGLYRVAPGGELRQWTTANGLSYDGTRFVFEDREHNLWVGTSGGGLMRFKRRAVESFGGESGLTERVVNSVSAGGDGHVWVGTYGKGLFKLTDGRAATIPLSDAAGAVAYVQSVLATRGGRVWVGTFGQGLWLIDGGRARRVGGSDLDRENVLALFEDSGGQVWIGGGNGLWVFDGTGVRGRGAAAADGTPIKAGVGFAENAQGDLWLTSGEAVYRRRDGRIEAVTNERGEPIRGVSCLKTDRGGDVWMGTIKAGLLRWREGRLARVDGESGLPVRALHAIVEDDQGYFWMTSSGGIVRAHRRDLVAVADGGANAVSLPYRLFDMADGMPSVECAGGRQPVTSRDASGRLWVATPKGVAVVDPAWAPPGLVAPTARLEVLAYERDPHPTSLGARRGRRTRVLPPFTDRIVLPPGSRHVEFHYTGLDLAAPEKVRFQVLLAGRESDWQDMGHDRTVHYHDPPPGEYVFKVRAAGVDGIWEPTGASLAFSVQPFLWQTAWFRVAVGAAAAGAVAGALAWIVRVRHRRLTEAARRARAQSAALVDLARSPAAARGDLDRAFAEITEAAARVLGVAEAGIWLFDDAGDELRCADLFDAPGSAHREGALIRVADHLRYFERLGTERVIDGPVGHRSTETAGRTVSDGEDTGGVPKSALHAAIRMSGKVVGVVRHEQGGAPREWLGDEIAFAAAVSDQVAQAIANARRERAARDLRESEGRFRLVVETAPNGVIMVDALGRIALVNAMIEKTFGYPRLALVGRPVEIILPRGRRERDARDPEQRARAGGAAGKGGEMSRVREVRGRRADGRAVPVEVGSNPVDTPEGTFELLCVTDVSERERAESQAAQLRNELAHLSRVTMLGELSGSLAHELNQPLTSILSNAQAGEHFLAAERPDLRELREILKDIVSEDKRAGEVIRRLRALFKKGEVQWQSLDANELLQDVLKLARSDLIDRGVSVQVRLSPGLPPVTADRVQVQQVLLNLVKNGCDAMEGAVRGDRRLDVASAVTSDGAGVRLSITDQGCGVAPEDVERIFEPFFTTKSSGMGLGLAVCRTIVQSHGGRLWIENNADRGASVHLVMPIARGDADRKTRDEQEGADGAGEALDQSPIVAGRSVG